MIRTKKRWDKSDNNQSKPTLSRRVMLKFSLTDIGPYWLGNEVQHKVKIGKACSVFGAELGGFLANILLPACSF